MFFRSIVALTLTLIISGLISAPALRADDLSPMDTIKGPVDEIISILKDPMYKQPDQKTAQRDKIWAAAQPMFDFVEISRRTIGTKWNTFTEEEKKKFTDVFSELLGNIYIDKMQGEYQNQQIVFLKELKKEPRALVQTKLVSPSGDIPIDYRMTLNDGQWYVYDILVENGVSLVKNYQVQFRSALQKETPAQLIQRLEKKLRE